MHMSFKFLVSISFATFVSMSSPLHAQLNVHKEDGQSPAGIVEAKPLLPEVDDVEEIKLADPSTAIEEIIEAPATPDVNDLSTAVDETIPTPTIPEAEPTEEFDENLFFDAEALAPQGELARKGAPSKVNPLTSPGSRLVISNQTYSANSVKARLVAADRAMKLGRFESALIIYNDLFSENKRDPNIMLGRAIALQKAGREDEALQAYEDLLDIRPKNVEANVNMQGLLLHRYPAVALRNLMDLREVNPGDTNILAQMAVAHAKLGQFNEAINALGTAASIEPENANHVYNMAVIADRAADRDRAIGYYEEALEIDTLYGASATIPREAVFQRLAELR